MGGLYDSFALSEALAAVVHGNANDEILDRIPSNAEHHIVSPISSDSLRLVFNSGDPDRLDKDLALLRVLVPAGRGPPPHRHDFEEMFTLLEGELEFTFRGKSHTVRAGSTVNVPANAPHAFKNVSGKTARML